MEIEHLEYAPHVASRGFSLAERAALTVSAVGLLHKSKFHHVVVWGKLYALRADYMVILAHSGDPLGHDASAFFSTDGGVNFALLAPVGDDTPAKAAPEQPETARAPVVPVTLWSLFTRASQSGALSGPFVGDPSFEYRLTDPLSGTVFVMKESQRLSCFVALQGHIGRVIPRGAYQRLAADIPASSATREVTAEKMGADLFTVRRNPAFVGLDEESAIRLTYYLHLRRKTQQRLLLEQEGTALHLDWLDPLSEDEPTGCWSLRYHPSAELVTGYSVELPGSCFFCRPNTTLFGSLYMGDGSVNRDIAFML